MGNDSGSQADGSEWETKARRAAKDVEAKRQVLETAVARRDQLLIEGIDSGLSVGHVARVMLVSAARVQQVLAAKG